MNENTTNLNYDINEVMNRIPKNYKFIRSILFDILYYGESKPWYYYEPIGRAAYYIGHYTNVWDRLDHILARYGIYVKYIPGKYGGRRSSKYILLDIHKKTAINRYKNSKKFTEV